MCWIAVWVVTHRPGESPRWTTASTLEREIFRVFLNLSSLFQQASLKMADGRRFRQQGETVARRPLIASLILAGVVQFTLPAYSAEVVVKVAPPAPQSVVVIGRAPGPKYVWIGGFYRWTGSRYVWVGGRWVVPARAGAVWVAPRWVPRNGGFVFVTGRWR